MNTNNTIISFLISYTFISVFFLVLFMKGILKITYKDEELDISEFKIILAACTFSVCWPFIIYKLLKGENEDENFK